MSHQIGTIFHANVVRQILVLFILYQSDGYITLVLSYKELLIHIGGTTQSLVLVGALINPNLIMTKFCIFSPVFL